MSHEILTLTPSFSIEEAIAYDTSIFPVGLGKEKRYSHRTAGVRDFALKLRYAREPLVNIIWDFYRARKGRHAAFWVKVPTQQKVTAESVGVGNNAQTKFYFDYFPIDPASVIIYFNGVAQPGSGFTASNNLTTEGGEVVFTAAPGTGVVITATYEFYWLVRFMEDRMSRELVRYKLLNMGIDLKQDLWSIYVPPGDEV